MDAWTAVKTAYNGNKGLGFAVILSIGFALINDLSGNKLSDGWYNTSHNIQDAIESALSEALGGSRPIIDGDKQGKHDPNNADKFIPGRSELTDPDPQGLLDGSAGNGEQVGPKKVGEPGSKERVNFGKEIGVHVDLDGTRSPTSNGIIHYDGEGKAHIVPSRPTTTPSEKE